MIQENEVVNLILGIAGVAILVFLARKVEQKSIKFFYVAFFAMLFAYITTVLEGLFCREIFNLIEHLSLAIAGILFAIGCRFLRKPDHNDNSYR